MSVRTDEEPKHEDTALLASAQAGNTASFDMLVRDHTPQMYRVAYRIVGDSAEAEDVVQDSWMSAWRSLARFRGDAKVSTWLYRVVTNTALAHLRRRRLTVPLESVLDGANSDLAGFEHHRVHDPEPSVLRRERASAVRAAINTLEPSQRIPLVLHELEGMSYEEVATILEVSVPALRSRLHRARVSLLAELKELR